MTVAQMWEAYADREIRAGREVDSWAKRDYYEGAQAILAMFGIKALSARVGFHDPNELVGEIRGWAAEVSEVTRRHGHTR
jgi:hypothetical protein